MEHEHQRVVGRHGYFGGLRAARRDWPMQQLECAADPSRQERRVLVIRLHDEPQIR